MTVTSVVNNEAYRVRTHERSFGAGTDTITRLDIYFDVITFEDSGLRIYERGLGSSFVLGVNPWGMLGSGFLGDNGITPWTQIGPSGLLI